MRAAADAAFLHGLMWSRRPEATVPCTMSPVAYLGTGTLSHHTDGDRNVFAREIGLPSSPDRIASTLLNGKVDTIPVGETNGRPVLFVVGIGLDAEAVAGLKPRALASSVRQAL